MDVCRHARRYSGSRTETSAGRTVMPAFRARRRFGRRPVWLAGGRRSVWTVQAKDHRVPRFAFHDPVSTGGPFAGPSPARSATSPRGSVVQVDAELDAAESALRARAMSNRTAAVAAPRPRARATAMIERALLPPVVLVSGVGGPGQAQMAAVWPLVTGSGGSGMWMGLAEGDAAGGPAAAAASRTSLTAAAWPAGPRSSGRTIPATSPSSRRRCMQPAQLCLPSRSGSSARRAKHSSGCTPLVSGNVSIYQSVRGDSQGQNYTHGNDPKVTTCSRR
jgi:hypothetical protein